MEVGASRFHSLGRMYLVALISLNSSNECMKQCSYGHSSPFPSLQGSEKPIWKWEEIENQSKRANKQAQSVVLCMKMCLFDVSFNVSVIEENQKAKLIFLQLQQYSFTLIQTK